MVKRKIAMIGWYKPQIGGGSHVVQNIVNRLKYRNYKIFIINMEEPKYLTGLGHWVDDNVDVYQERLWYPQGYTNLQTLVQTTKRAFLIRNKIHLYHAHGAAFSGIGLVDKNKPFVLTMHGYASLEAVNSGKIKPNSIQFKFLRWLEQSSVERADAIIAVGRKLKEWILNELQADREKVFVIPNGVDTDTFYFCNINRELFGYSSDDEIILFVKYYTENSGINYLLQAISIIKQTRPKIKLIAIGGGPLKEKMTNLAHFLNIEKSVVFLDRVPYAQVTSYYNLSNIYVLPSIPMGEAEETFSLSLLEAMACGKPVIATSIGGPKEILEDGMQQMGDRVGMLIPPKNPEAIAEAIIYLLENPIEAREMGQRAREYVLKNYTWDRIVNKTLQVYEYAMEKYND